MESMKKKQLWFVVGSQDLYGEAVLQEVGRHAREIAAFMDASPLNPGKVAFKAVVRNAAEILAAVKSANGDDACAGVMVWMHTFSPAKMWIKGLAELKKPLLHLHTQYNEMLPYDEIDMDFMNLNQAAHGDREFGYICTRLGLRRKVVAGYYKDEELLKAVFGWFRAAAAADYSRTLNVVRFGDNMREVAVTDGDKVEAERVFGWSVNGWGLGGFVETVNAVSDAEVDALMAEYKRLYTFLTDDIASVREQAKYEIALKKYLGERNAMAFTTNFQDLTGLKQLPGMACQRLMGAGYGFGGEGDWKVSALTAVMKYMAEGRKGAVAFMEDYTYHLEKGKELALGAHMLEVCPSLASSKPEVRVLPLGIGDREPPARLTFDSLTGPGLVVSLVDMGDRFRMIVNKIELVKEPKPMPKLPVARTMWKPLPDLKTSAAAWIYAGGAHHTVLTTALTVEELYDLAEIFGVEFVLIDEKTDLFEFRRRYAGV